MKTNDLMLGDLVYYSHTEDGIAPYKEVIRIQAEDLCRDACIIETHYEPIPLTPEMLEKNGWRSRMNGTGEFYLKKPLVDAAIITKTIMGFQMNHRPFCGLSIHYVHELQHALRLCRIDKEIVL